MRCGESIRLCCWRRWMASRRGVALRKLPRVEGGCEMKRLWVESDFRGMRIGRRLVEDAILWARREGMTAMYLDTIAAAMPEAVRLYAAMGFVRMAPYHGDCTTDVEFFPA